MNRKIFLFKVVYLAILFSMVTQHTFARDTLYCLEYELKKAYSKEFPIASNAQVEISNKYGNIEYQTWNKSAVKIDVQVIVHAANRKKADEKMDEIIITLQKNGDNVLGSTTFESTNQSWWSSWWESNSDAKIEIHYVVHLPDYVSTATENKYGNIYLADFKNSTNINLKYGNLQGCNILGDLTMTIAYGKANFTHVQNMTLDIAYSGIKVETLGTAVVNSKYSKVQFQEMKSLVASSKYDGYKIGNLSNLTFSGAYGDLELGTVGAATFSIKYTGLIIKNLTSTLVADLDYGSLSVQYLKSSLKSIKIVASYAPINIGGDIACKVQLSGKYFDAKLGQDFVVQNREESGNFKSYKAYKGSERTGSSIHIETKYGDVTIK